MLRTGMSLSDMYLHSGKTFSRDCAARNIMMDARPLFPEGHHPVRMNYTPDAVFPVHHLNRQDHPVKYYFIDFGISSHFSPDDVPLVVGTKGRDKEPPELSDTQPYNPFPLDIFILGNVYLQEFVQVSQSHCTTGNYTLTVFEQKYHGLDFLHPLIIEMLQPEPQRRPTAQEARTIFQGIRASLNESTLRWRLRSRQESAPERVVYDTVAAAREGIYRIKHMII